MSDFPSPSKEAKIWAATAASLVKTATANNPNDVYLFAFCPPTIEEYNSMNKDDNLPVMAGICVLYGPFSGEKEAENFVAEYKEEWPGNNDWMKIHPGNPFLLTNWMIPGYGTIVHDASSSFQAQLGVNEMKRKQEELKKLKQEFEKMKNDQNNRLNETSTVLDTTETTTDSTTTETTGDSTTTETTT